MSKFALLIGINYENDTAHKLNGCINDARNVKKVLQSVLEYPDSNITLLTDDTKLPTRNNIEEEFQSLLLKINSRECSEAWIHYSGHGYFLTDHGIDELDGKDETLVPLDYSSAGLIRDDYLYENFIDKITNPDLKLMIVMDCCHSGTHMDLRWKVNTKNELMKVSTKHAQVGQIVCLSGCKDEQVSMDTYDFNNLQEWSGALTSSFLRELQQSNYTITFLDLLQNIRKLLQAKNYKQIPQLTCNFDLLSMNFMKHKKQLQKKIQQDAMKRQIQIIKEQETQMKQIREIRTMKTTQLTTLQNQQFELSSQRTQLQKKVNEYQTYWNQYQADLQKQEQILTRYQQLTQQATNRIVNLQPIIQETWSLYSQFLQNRTRYRYQLYIQQFTRFKQAFLQNKQSKVKIEEYKKIINSKQFMIAKLQEVLTKYSSELSKYQQQLQVVNQELVETNQKIQQIQAISETATVVNNQIGGNDSSESTVTESFINDANNDSKTFFLIQ